MLLRIYANNPTAVHLWEKKLIYYIIDIRYLIYFTKTCKHALWTNDLYQISSATHLYWFVSERNLPGFVFEFVSKQTCCEPAYCNRLFSLALICNLRTNIYTLSRLCTLVRPARFEVVFYSQKIFAHLECCNGLKPATSL